MLGVVGSRTSSESCLYACSHVWGALNDEYGESTLGSRTYVRLVKISPPLSYGRYSFVLKFYWRVNVIAGNYSNGNKMK